MAKRILLIEDSQTTVALLKERIEAANYEVLAAYNGEDGLKQMKDLKPDLVLLDVRMPGIDGFEVCRIAKDDPEIKSIPIIFVTTAAQEVDVEKGKKLLAEGYITKPYEGKELVKEIRRVLKE
ncbi:MAG: response regulator [Candidatus Omnitrophica bacterium]|nr:response regulator [Candidatus Omnitrophota bacterium]